MRAQVSRKVAWWSKSREEPWRAQAASPRQSRSNPNHRGNRVDTIFRAGLLALLFFFETLFCKIFVCKIFGQIAALCVSRRSGSDGKHQSDPAQFRTGRGALRGFDAAGLPPPVP